MVYARNTFVILLFGLFFIFIQSSLLKEFFPSVLVPNFVLSLVVFLAFYENSPFGALLAFLLGLEVDFYSGQFLLVGPSAGAYVAIFGLMASLSQRIFVDSGFAIFVATVVAVFGSTVVYAILIYEFNTSGIMMIPSSLVSAMVTGIFTPFIFRMVRPLFLRGNLMRSGRVRSLAG